MDEMRKEVRGKTMGYIGAAFGLVAGLAWNEAITALIAELFPISKDSLMIKFLYAIVLTFVVVMVVRYMEKIFDPKEKGYEKGRSS